MKKVSFFLTDQHNYQIDWDIAFPADHQTIVVLFTSNTNSYFGVVVRRLNEQEARFIIRGELVSEKDLAVCLQEAEKTAQLMGCRILTTQEKIDTQWLNSFEIFLNYSFKSINKTVYLEGPFKSFADRILKVESVMLQRKVLPKGARITSLGEGQQQARALLHNTFMMDDFEFDNRLKHDALSPLSENYSQLAWNDNEIIGVLLVAKTKTDELFDIPIRYVIPTYRQTWVNTFLVAACVKHGFHVNAKCIRFEANLILHQETLSLAKKTGCQITRTFSRFEKHLFT